MNTITSPIGSTVSATEILREDHRRIKALFREFESAAESTKPSIAEHALNELELHSTIEERCFYPSVRKIVGDKRILDAREAHRLVDSLIQELKVTPAGRRFNARFSLLVDNVLAHIKEEEGVMFPAVESGRIDLAALGRELAHLKYSELGSQAVRRTAAKGLGLGGMTLLAGAAALIYALVAAPAKR
jgi:hemerythrin superfamily protein